MVVTKFKRGGGGVSGYLHFKYIGFVCKKVGVGAFALRECSAGRMNSIMWEEIGRKKPAEHCSYASRTGCTSDCTVDSSTNYIAPETSIICILLFEYDYILNMFYINTLSQLTHIVCYCRMKHVLQRWTVSRRSWSWRQERKLSFFWIRMAHCRLSRMIQTRHLCLLR
jgi:hypothetical protein